jgi:Uncharacterized protein, possibly involved in aromatic compounds catabolism
MTVDLAAAEESGGRGEESRLAALSVLAQQVRELMDAAALTDVDEDEITGVTAELVALTERLNAARRDTPRRPEIAPDGSYRHLGNAVAGACNPHALPLEVQPTPEGGVRADLAFRPLHEGPPGAVHGGVTAMILDQLLGSAAAMAGRLGMTATLTIRYRRPTPYGRPLVATAEVARTEGRKTWVEGRIATPDDTVLVEATGLFITPAQWVGSA